MNETSTISGYTYGSTTGGSPIMVAEFEQMKKSVLFDDSDVEALKRSYEVVKDQVEDILDVWYGFVGANAHLLESFTDKNSGAPIPEYLDRVRKRFGQWILDTASGRYDQDWLDYQHEIGLRHHRTGKNRTDNVDSTAIIPLRHIILLTFPITHTLKPFLAKGGHSVEEVDAMHNAWVKSCLLQVTLWSYPYVRQGDF